MGRRAVQLPIIDGFLWLVRIGAIVVVVWGATQSLSSGRLSAEQWRNLVVVGITQGSVYALIALGYTMVYGVLRFINFAHGEVFMSGAIVGYFVADALARAGVWASQPFLSLAIVLVCSMATSTLIAVGLERVAYRPLRGAPRLIPLITSIGASFFLQYAVFGLFGAQTKTYPAVPALAGSFELLGFRILKSNALVIVLALA